MITIYMGIIICGTASVLLIKEVERRAQKEKLNRKQLSTLRLLTLCCLFVFTPAFIVIIRLLIRKKVLSDILTLSIIPLVFIACYSIRSKMILKYTIKDFSWQKILDLLNRTPFLISRTIAPKSCNDGTWRMVVRYFEKSKYPPCSERWD